MKVIELNMLLNTVEFVVNVLGALGLLFTMVRILLIMVPPLIEDIGKLWVELKKATKALKVQRTPLNSQS